MNRKRLGRLLLALLSIIPKKYPIATKRDLPSPFFIINSGRCGSTMLNRLLNQHSQVFLPSEQYFIHNLIVKFRLYNWILWRDLGKVLAGEIVTSLETHTWNLDYEQLFADIVLAKGDERSLEYIIDRILRVHAQQLGKQPFIWGDTTPLTAHYVQEVYSVYPNSKYLFLVRDGRDVAASYKRRDNAPYLDFTDHFKCARNWRLVYQQYRWLHRRGADILEVKYEDLVTDPNQKMAEIFAHLGVENEPVNTQDIQVPDIPFYRSVYHDELKNPISTRRIGRWKENLSEQELADIMPIIAPVLKELGYPE